MEGKQNPTAHNWQLFDNWKHPAQLNISGSKQNSAQNLFHDDNIRSNRTNMKAANDHHSDDDRVYGGDCDDDDNEKRDDSISDDDVDDILTRSEYISCNAATLSALKFSSTLSLGKWFGIIMSKEGLFSCCGFPI